MSLTLHAETISEQVADNSRLVNPYEGSFSYEVSSPVDIQLPNFSLTADSGSLLHGVDIQVSMLLYKSGTMMPSNMENVSRFCDGIRLLPNGEHFDTLSPAYITLTYDPLRLPIGYSPLDIYTCYYDELDARWQMLYRVNVDTLRHTITSLTTHFTDFANAIIKVPEMPESKAYVPTAMTDIPDANPLFGTPMIAPPTPNNRGTAEVTYPIVLPKGRNGIQPNIDLHYSSAAGDGILGIGWSLNTPAITIDTRWGVPRYDPIYETEQYLVNGEQILWRDEHNNEAIPLPFQSDNFELRKGGRVRFYPRDTKNQERIFRYGFDPTSYWWKVTDAQGITTYYGRVFDPFDLNNDHIDEHSVVRTEDGCIAYWAATASIDPWGNAIIYQNYVEDNVVYVHQILYTCNISPDSVVLPRYAIKLSYNTKFHGFTSGRLGVLQAYNRNLCRLRIDYHPMGVEIDKMTEHIANYFFCYDSPTASNLYKYRLNRIIKLDSLPDNVNDGECRHCELFYHTSLGDYPGSVTTFDYKDAPSANLLGNPVLIQGTPIPHLNETYSSSWNIGGTGTVGLPIHTTTTIFSGGGNYSYSRSQGAAKFMLLDLDGDGLADIVSENKDTVWYKKQLYNSNQSNIIFADAVPIQGIHCLSHEVTSTHTWGLQASIGANLSYSNPHSFTYTDTYFTDVNGDGLPDMVANDRLLINHLVNNLPTFIPYDADSTNSVAIHGSICGTSTITGGVDEHLDCYVKETFLTKYPYDKLYNYFSFNESQEEEIKDSTIIYPTLTFGDDSIVPIGNTFEYNGGATSIVDASATMSSMGSMGSMIYRAEGNSISVYRLDYICEETPVDSTIDMVRVWVAPHAGSIILRDTIRLLEDNSPSRQLSRKVDGVKYIIQHSHSVTPQADSIHLHAATNTIVYNGEITENDYLNHTLLDTIQVSAGDIIFFRLRSGKDNQYDNTYWQHCIQYIDSTTIYNAKTDFLCTGEKHFMAPKDGDAYLKIHVKTGVMTPIQVLVQVIDTLQQVHLRSSKMFIQAHMPHTSRPMKPIWVQDTLHLQGLHANEKVVISVTYLKNTTQRIHPENPFGHLISFSEPQWSNVEIYADLDFASTFPDSDTFFVADTLHYHPDISKDFSSIYPNENSPYRKLFGPLHKGWGQFAYNDMQDTSIIVPDSLYNTTLQAAQNANSSGSLFQNSGLITIDTTSTDWEEQIYHLFDTAGIYRPLTNTYWVPVESDCKSNEWIAYGNMGHLSKSLHSNSRSIATVQGDSIEEITIYDSPIPQSETNGTPPVVVRKKSYSCQHGLSLGAPVLFNRSLSHGFNRVDIDYMDMNGDGFPDFVGLGGIQYSTPWGGIGSLQYVPNFANFLNTSTSGSDAFSGSTALLEKLIGNNVKDGKYTPSNGMGVSGGAGDTDTEISFVDINGDGLPDRVDAAKDSVWYNLGYKFSRAYALSNIIINSSSNTNGSVDISASAEPWISDAEALFRKTKDWNQFPKEFSLAQVSISGGLGTSVSNNITNTQLMDINGDGLPDKVVTLNNNDLIIYLNVGNNFWGNGIIIPNSSISVTKTFSRHANVALTLGFSFGFAKLTFGIQSTPWSESVSVEDSRWTDMNGDGLLDYVFRADNGNTYVRYNQSGGANLLTRISNPTAATIDINYSLSAPTTSHRARQWEMVRIMDIDTLLPMPSAALRRTDIVYSTPRYDSHERSDYGYHIVTTTLNEEKKIQNIYNNTTLLNHGEKVEDWLTDVHNQKFIHNIYNTRYRDVVTNDTTNDICNDANIREDVKAYRTEYYEGQSTAAIVTAYDITYDQFHNISVYHDFGDTAITGDEWQQNITYLPNAAHNMVSLPITERITDGANHLFRKSEVVYNAKGKPARIIQSDTILSIYADSYFLYDEFGNLRLSVQPENAHAQRYWTQYTYEPDLHTYVCEITNPFRQTTFTQYDYRWGLPTLTVDPAGMPMRYTYDYRGRLLTVTAPREFGLGLPYTVRYQYFDRYPTIRAEKRLPWAYVMKNMYDSAAVNCEVTLFDGRGDVLQKKHYADYYGRPTWIVDGVQIRDGFNRIIEQCPAFISHQSIKQYEYMSLGMPITQYEYDVQDRLLWQHNPDNTEQQIHYGFNPDFVGTTRLASSIIDENGLRTHLLTSPQGWQVQQIAPDSSITWFQYNGIGELIRVVDADKYETHYNYDMFGHRITREHPDAGKTWRYYDKAGNLIQLQTQQHINTQDYISYNYSFNRLTDILYPLQPEMNVHYEYDHAGRIASRFDETGRELFSYDELGNVQQSIRRIIIPTEKLAYTFRTQYRYDSFGRIRSITYPDSELVTYRYTNGGLLTGVRGLKDTQTHIYLDTCLYDEQGRKTEQVYGNSITSQYTYNVNRQWLETLKTFNGHDTLQSLHYSYDGVGNILRIDQTAPHWAAHFGGPYYNEYFYDQQYRLTTSKGFVDYPYEFDADYSGAGRLGHRYCTDLLKGMVHALYGYHVSHDTHQPRTIFDNKLGNPISLFWDANGNMAQVVDCARESFRLQDWDDENRLRLMLDPKVVAYYGYDGNGERVYKLTGRSNILSHIGDEINADALLDDAVLYPNPYIVITPKSYTKHYYAGTERLATVIGQGGFNLMDTCISHLSAPEEDLCTKVFKRYESQYPLRYKSFGASQLNETIKGKQDERVQYKCEPMVLNTLTLHYDHALLLNQLDWASEIHDKEPDIYFYHGDHLGSANWITDAAGRPIQYIHYAPYGELIADTRLTNYRERFKFTGKERDEESGYDYFGARYYWSLLMHWLSVDPLADKYPGISPYAYCNWNPIKYVDPDGKGVFPSKEALRQAGENVVNNPNYQRQGRTTFCNIGAQAINAQAGDRSLLGRANEMGISLRNPEIATEISQSEALEYANMGAVVFASYVSNGGEPGHIAIVAPTEGLTYSPTRNESVVSVFNVGSQNGEMPLSYAFGKRSVGMFILNNDLNTLKGISTSNGGNFQEIPAGEINEIVVTGKGTTKLEVPIKAIDVKLPNASLNF